VKEFRKSVKISQKYGYEFGVQILAHPTPYTSEDSDLIHLKIMHDIGNKIAFPLTNAS